MSVTTDAILDRTKRALLIYEEIFETTAKTLFTVWIKLFLNWRRTSVICGWQWIWQNFLQNHVWWLEVENYQLVIYLVAKPRLYQTQITEVDSRRWNKQCKTKYLKVNLMYRRSRINITLPHLISLSFFTIQIFSSLHCKFFTIETGPSGCPNHTKAIAGKCYLFSNHTKKWHDARKDCQKRGGDLLVIEDAEKEEIFMSKCTYSSIHV